MIDTFLTPAAVALLTLLIGKAAEVYLARTRQTADERKLTSDEAISLRKLQTEEQTALRTDLRQQMADLKTDLLAAKAEIKVLQQELAASRDRYYTLLGQHVELQARYKLLEDQHKEVLAEVAELRHAVDARPLR